MESAAEQLSLHIELAKVLRQLREVQIRALNEPSYRMLVRYHGERGHFLTTAVSNFSVFLLAIIAR